MTRRLSALEASGVYGAAYRIIDVSFVPVSALFWSAYPSFSRRGARGICTGRVTEQKEKALSGTNQARTIFPAFRTFSK